MIQDLSIAGVNIRVHKIYDLGPCSDGVLKMKIGSKENPYLIEVQGELVRFDHDTIVYKLVGSTLDNFQHLKKAILDHTSTPENVIKEIQFNPELSLNSLYLPAMQEAISCFVQDAVQSVFKVYLETDVSTVQATQADTPSDITVTGISSFNGALYGSVILMADLAFAQSVIANLLELKQKMIDMPMIVDGFGEMTNMIAGGVQTGLAEEYENIFLIPPTVFVGAQCVYGSDQLFSIKNYFHCPMGSFSVDCLFSIV